MSAPPPMWVGADPGGKGAFGIAVLRGRRLLAAKTCDHASEAVEFVMDHCGANALVAAGVDAPLWWSSGASGDRKADQWIRRTYGLGGGRVQASNSLRGAALVQGAMFCQRLREAFPRIGLTEAHPKALLSAIAGDRWRLFAARFGVSGTPRSEHVRDALVAAVAAREGFLGRWKHDLANERGAFEQDPAAYWLAPVHYFWPEA